MDKPETGTAEALCGPPRAPVGLAGSADGGVSFFLPYVVWAVAGGLVYLWILIAAVLMLARIDRYAGAAGAVGHPVG